MSKVALSTRSSSGMVPRLARSLAGEQAAAAEDMRALLDELALVHPADLGSGEAISGAAVNTASHVQHVMRILMLSKVNAPAL